MACVVFQNIVGGFIGQLLFVGHTYGLTADLDKSMASCDDYCSVFIT